MSVQGNHPDRPGSVSAAGHQSQRFLVHAEEPGLLSQLINAVRHDRSVQLEQTIGPPGAPHTAVINMSQQQAQQLRDRFPGGRLTIEPDQPLSPLDNGTGGI